MVNHFFVANLFSVYTPYSKTLDTSIGINEAKFKDNKKFSQ